MTELSCNNLKFLPKTTAPNGNKPVTMNNIDCLDVVPIEYDEDIISEFLSTDTRELKKKHWIKLRLLNINQLDSRCILYRKEYVPTGKLSYKTTNFLKFAMNTCPPTWYHVFKLAYPALQQIAIGLKNTALQGKRIVPDMKDVFSAFHLCPFHKVKVVFIGQGPYPWIDDDKPIANGMAFSSRKGAPAQNSLQNIYRELIRSYLGTDTEFTDPGHGDLSSWERQGALMLNATLTGEEKERGTYSKIGDGRKNSKEPHKGRWNSLLKCVIGELTRYHQHLIFVTWGQDSQKALEAIGMTGKHTILRSAHPSGMAAGAKDKFLGCGHFVKINEILVENEKTPIDWRIE
jgi:uracil-DNA glycosylase